MGDMGKVMANLKAALTGKADMATVSRQVKNATESSVITTT
ncbi:MAG: hypothetical protein Ct9H300mP8_05560 [Gammaproteobacteria bacterium]|nr:MAG: hypothetical protein Ct9H300mP8_05560 [Gammaproteobacteria bacterium]